MRSIATYGQISILDIARAISRYMFAQLSNISFDSVRILYKDKLVVEKNSKN